MTTRKYTLYESDNQGYFNEHTQNLTLEEAKEMLQRHKNCFPNTDWMIQGEQKQESESRYYNDKAIDGWEDIYQH